jgi:hypothetical protein
VEASSPNAALVSAERAYFSYKFDGRERACLGSSPIKIACTLNRTRADLTVIGILRYPDVDPAEKRVDAQA